ncbi:unnamed protein product [Schistosoma curassoni]|uniref:Uncharacterized protein n=1 Tax=Schistosoma curassoni TaxID=6186 RepID=A0A183JKJ0_9TREM|nr:unnamed protein product [Schistosoma curassoni]
MVESKRYSSSSTDTASVSDSPEPNTPANKSPNNSKVSIYMYIYDLLKVQ